jgi:hypothetical protein
MAAWRRVALFVRVWMAFVEVRVDRRPLPQLVARQRPRRPRRRVAPARLSSAVYRSLNIGPLRTRCMWNALVLFRLLRAQGDEAALVIGLPADATDQSAHAWVELAGRDIGPYPGRNGHEEMARYG